MKEIIKNKLYSFDEKVRVEIGPQIIELDCTDENLSNKVTHANYQIGKIDAFGKSITKELVAENGAKISCVDWDAKHAPHLYKVYQMQEVAENDNRFIKVDEFENKDEALAFAGSLYKEMK